MGSVIPLNRHCRLDFPGHGRSMRRPLSAPYYLWGYVAEVRAVVEHFGWQQFTLLGHSMGGAVACLYAALYPVELTRLILLDILMPGMDGYEVCRRLKSDPASAKIPVIFVTGSNDLQSEETGFHAGCVDYLTKPVSEAMLISTLRGKLRRFRGLNAMV